MSEAKVSLISSTPNPIALMCYVRRVMHSPVPDSLEEFENNIKKYLGATKEQYFQNTLLKDGMPTYLEYISFTFKLENVSRALQQQLTRHRIGFSYSIQSLRCVNLPYFATNYQYYNPYYSDAKNKEAYHNNMINIQSEYRKALKAGVPTQDARGLLPMNIYSTITFSCTLRALIGMVNKRLCLKTQDEFRKVAAKIVEQVKAIDPLLAKLFHAPCENGFCMMESENQEQLKAGLLKGKQNTDHVCPTYYRKWGIKNE